MKTDMKVGEYTRYAKKSFRCVASNLSPMKRCQLCDLRPYGLCPYVRCQPDERADRQAVIFRLTRKSKKEIETGNAPSGQRQNNRKETKK